MDSRMDILPVVMYMLTFRTYIVLLHVHSNLKNSD